LSEKKGCLIESGPRFVIEWYFNTWGLTSRSAFWKQNRFLDFDYDDSSRAGISVKKTGTRSSEYETQHMDEL
jgi:hypothetical protein